MEQNFDYYPDFQPQITHMSAVSVHISFFLEPQIVRKFWQGLRPVYFSKNADVCVPETPSPLMSANICNWVPPPPLKVEDVLCGRPLGAILLNQKLSHAINYHHMKYWIKKRNLVHIVLTVCFLQKNSLKVEYRKPSFICIFLADWHDIVWSLEVISYCLRDARAQILVIRYMCTCSHCFNGCWSNHL